MCPDDRALAPISVACWRNLVFVHLGDDPPPFDEAIAPFDAECEAFGIESFALRAARSSASLACNWKTYADNYLEGYHVALLHPSLSRSLDMSTYRVDVPHDSLLHPPRRHARDRRLAVRGCSAIRTSRSTSMPTG